MKKRNIYVVYNSLLGQGGLKHLPMGIENVKTLFAFIKKLGDELQDVHKYVKEHTDGKGGLVEGKVEGFEKMLDIEIADFDAKLELDFTDEMLKKNLTLGHVEGLMFSGML